MKKSILKIIISFVFYGLTQAHAAENLKTTLEDWLDPALKEKAYIITATVEELQKEEKVKNPTPGENMDFGFNFMYGTKFDWMCLSIVKGKKIKHSQKHSSYRVPFVDLGCGSMGFISTLAVFAGATVDAVDFRETVTEANKRIYQNTKKVIGYNKEDVKTYYRAFPENLITETGSLWNQTPHLIAYCANLLHFFTEGQIQQIASRIFDNLISDGILFLQTDTPLFSKSSLEFYKNRQGLTLCPGLAIYNKEKGSDGLKMIANPIPFIEKIHTIRTGQIYEGEFTESGEVANNQKIYHHVRNLFLVEDLAKIFENIGFKTTRKFYLNYAGSIIPYEEGLPKIGKPSKACVILIKP